MTGAGSARLAAPTFILPDPPAPPAPMGLIGAGGNLPLLVARGMRERGHGVRCAGLAGQYEPELPDLCDEFVEVGALRPGTWGGVLRRLGVRHAVMVGRVDKAQFMHSWRDIVKSRPDISTARAWFRSRKDRRSHVLLAFVADELAREGVQLIDSTAHIPEHLATAGPMTERKPTAGQKTDIDFGWPMLLELLKLDIGQAVTIRECDVVAVEAVEGTDRMIERTGSLCRSPGWVLLKSARSGHDRRADVPTVGPTTVELVHKHGGRAIALGAGDVIVIDKPRTLTLADKLGVSVFGMPPV